jgi:hypothetical protein
MTFLVGVVFCMVFKRYDVMIKDFKSIIVDFEFELERVFFVKT